jgi:DNA-binding MarR family transcriptional regulator
VPAEPIRTAEYKELLRGKLLESELVDPAVVDRMEVMFDLMRLTARLSRDFELVHRPRGWTWAGFRIANLLWVLGSLEPGELARLSGASRASISSALNTLEAGGHVTRRTRASDRRHVEVTLTDKGRRALIEAIAAQAEREHAWLDTLSSDERATLGKLLGRLVEQPRPERRAH